MLEGLAITELPEFIATQYFPDGQLEPILTDWRLPEGGLYFVDADGSRTSRQGRRLG